MGGYLSEPVTEKHSKFVISDRLSYGISSMQGWRTDYEDAHNCIIDFDDNTSFFGLYDGHGGIGHGKAFPIYISMKLPDYLKSMPDYKKGGDLSQVLEDCFLQVDASLVRPRVRVELKKLIRISQDTKLKKKYSKDSDRDLPPHEVLAEYNALTKKRLKKKMKTAGEKKGKGDLETTSDSSGGSIRKKRRSDWKPGCPLPFNIEDCSDVDTEDEEYNDFVPTDSGNTALVTLLRGNQLYVANAGDCRCVLSRKGKAVDLSVDHRLGTERERIRRAIGDKAYKGSRFETEEAGCLCRGFGDFVNKRFPNVPFRDQPVTARPDVQTTIINPQDDEFMILACDGIWDCKSSQEVVDFVTQQLKKENNLATICEALLTHCLAPEQNTDIGCDNMSAIIVKFHNKNDGQKKKRKITT